MESLVVISGKIWAALLHWIPGLAAIGYALHVDKKKIAGASGLVLLVAIGALFMVLGSLTIAKLTNIHDPITNRGMASIDLIYFYSIEFSIGLFGVAIINQLQSSLPAQIPLLLDAGRELLVRLLGGSK
jgi:hypothetical protein